MKHTVSLKSSRTFRWLYRRGKSVVTPYFVVYAQKNKIGRSRLGVSASVKVGNAVKRNRIRRRLRELYRIHEPELKPGYDIILVARTRGLFAKFSKLEGLFLEAAKKLELTRP